MKALYDLSPDETKEYVDMINEGKLIPKLNQTYLEAYIEYKKGRTLNTFV